LQPKDEVGFTKEGPFLKLTSCNLRGPERGFGCENVIIGLPPTGMATLVQCVAGRIAALDRPGVRFTLESGHQRTKLECPLWAADSTDRRNTF
jgi:hypothetical protein